MPQQKFKLTKHFIEKQIELPNKGQLFFWDAELKGFGVRVTAGGISFVCQSRVNGRTRRVKIGKYGAFTIKTARDQAKIYLADMSKGVDPNLEKQKKRVEAITLEELVQDYIKDTKLKPRSIQDINWHLNSSFSHWKRKPIIAFKRAQIKALFQKKSETSPAQANQAFRVLRALFNYAIKEYRPDECPIITDNPVNVLSGMWHDIKPKNRRVPLKQLGEAWNYLQELKESPVIPMAGKSIIDAVCFTILTGGRWGEVSTLKWKHVSLTDETWKIIDPKNHNPVTFPLSTQALAILENRPQYNEFVFCSDLSKTGHVGDARPTTNKLSEKIQTPVSAHDLRRTFRSIAAECNIELWRTKMLMNHKMKNDVTLSAYTEKEDLEYLRPDIEKIGKYVEEQSKISAAGNVVPLDRGRKEA